MIGREIASGSLQEGLSKSELNMMWQAVVWEAATTFPDMSGITSVPSLAAKQSIRMPGAKVG